MRLCDLENYKITDVWYYLACIYIETTATSFYILQILLKNYAKIMKWK